jgi:hypothetical protein
MKVDPNKVIKTEPKMVKDGWGLVSSAVIGLVLLIGTIIFLSSCEKEWSSKPNYRYTFSARVVKDQWGVETWGSHHFITDEPITNKELFKKCYVAYLKRTGKDVDGLYNRIYWTDNKLVKIQYDGTTYNNITVKNINDCVE